MSRSSFVLLVSVAALVAASNAIASQTAPGDNWLPHPAGATWTYKWTDSVYSPTPTTEKVTVKKHSGDTFTLGWTTTGLDNPDTAVSSTGTVSFQDTDEGIVNTDWNSGPPPANFPTLCAQQAGCGNSLASTYYNIIWGSRNPVLKEPLQQGVSWDGTGGSQGDVSGTSFYLGTQKIRVPAFSSPVTAAEVRTQIAQAGALGDPYGSGTRTTWWVYGVGPVKVVFAHTGGTGAPVMTSVLKSTSLKPLPPPNDLDYFPLVKGRKLTYKWTNTKHLAKPEIDTISIDAAVNDTARFTIKKTTGPIKAVGSYIYTKRVTGVTNLSATTAMAEVTPQPPLGPASSPLKSRNHFASALDLMNFGLNPILTAYPGAGEQWTSSRTSSEFTTYGVTAKTTVLGLQKVTVPAGTFEAMAVRSTLKQPGFPYGSGTRTSWFAPGKGLVKLVFKHGDGSVSTVVLMH